MKKLLFLIPILLAFTPPTEQPLHVSRYLNLIENDAQFIADLYGIPKELIQAQACQESGFGMSYRCQHYCSHFGVSEGYYNTQIECFFAYAKVLTLPCYEELNPKTLEQWFDALMCCHYASDPNYTKSLKIIIEKYLK